MYLQGIYIRAMAAGNAGNIFIRLKPENLRAAAPSTVERTFNCGSIGQGVYRLNSINIFPHLNPNFRDSGTKGNFAIQKSRST